MVSKISYLNTEAFLQESNAFADQVLHPEGDIGSTGTTVHHTHSHWGSPAWGWGYYPQPVYVEPSVGPCNDSKKRENPGLAILVGTAALAVLYPTAQNWAEWSQAKNGMAKVREKLQAVEPEIAAAHPALRATVHSVYQKEMAMLDHLRTDARNGFCLKGVLVASLAAVSYTAWIGSPISIIPILGGLAATGAMIWRSGIRSIQNEVKSEARELQIAVSQAARVLDTING